MLSFFRSPPDQPRRARLAEEQWPGVVYAIGDVHGCLSELLQLEALIAEDSADHQSPALIIMLGDYIDRGPSSAGVLDHLSLGSPSLARRICLAGNHETMMLDFVDRPRPDHQWLPNGGTETLHSYGLDPRTLFEGGKRRASEKLASHIPQEHIEFLSALPLCLGLPGYVFVHAGLRPGLSIADQMEEDMLWMRGGDYPLQPFGVVVHGHTPAPQYVIKTGHICVDTGAFATGVLTALRIVETGELSFLQTNRAA